MFLATLATKMSSISEVSPLVKVVREGLGIGESSVVFAISPSSVRDDTREVGSKAMSLPATPSSAFFLSQASRPPVRSGVEQNGNIFSSYASCLDTALWKVGGAAIALRLVQLATVSIISIHATLLSM